jgi:predicted nucleic acid-binding protein
VFLRFLLGDNSNMERQTLLLFQRAEEGEFELHTTHLALAEIAWVLNSYYRLPRARIAYALRQLLGLRSLRLDFKETVSRAVDLYASSNIDYVDAYHVADCQRRGLAVICSYDHDFDTVGANRIEPGVLVRPA